MKSHNRNLKESFIMSLTRIKEKYQVTIPASIRKKLDLHVGDVFDAEVQDDTIVFHPKTLVDRSQAVQQFIDLVEQVHQENENIPDDEVMQDVMDAIQDVRTRKHADRRT